MKRRNTQRQQRGHGEVRYENYTDPSGLHAIVDQINKINAKERPMSCSGLLKAVDEDDIIFKLNVPQGSARYLCIVDYLVLIW